MAICARSVLVTGGNRGIGLEMVRQLAALPTPPKHLLVTCRNPDSAEELKLLANQHESIKIFPLDVRHNERFPQFVEQVSDVVGEKGLTMLINNSGILESFSASLDSITKEALINSLDVNAVAPFLLSQACLPLLRKSAAAAADQKSDLCCNRAAIINVSTLLASITDSSGKGYLYRSSKCALNMLSNTLHHELSKEGILVGLLHPGWVQTDMGGKHAAVTPTDSVTGMLNVIASMDETKAGKLVDYQGKVLPW